MSLRMLLHAVRRHKAVFGVVVGLGLLLGAAFTVIRPPLLASKVLVVIPQTRSIQTEAVIADSDTVLNAARLVVDPSMPLTAFQRRVQVVSVTPTVLSVTGLSQTAGSAQATANAVARSFVGYIDSPGAGGEQTQAQLFGSAAPATGATLGVRLVETAGLGGVLGVLVGAVIVAGISRTDRRLRERDEIAGVIGVPVLASVPVVHPSDTAGWVRLLEDYEPGVVHAWSLRKALRLVGVADGSPGAGAGVALAVVSLSADRGALAVGPQLAVFAASLGIPTTLVIGPQQDPDATAALSAACTTMSARLAGQDSRLRFAVGDYRVAGRQPGAGLTVMVAVADGRSPQLAGQAEATATLLGVSAGAATAEQLARLAVSIAGQGRDITGIVVADPDPADRTTGRVQQLGQPSRPRHPAQHRHSAGVASTAGSRR